MWFSATRPSPPQGWSPCGGRGSSQSVRAHAPPDAFSDATAVRPNAAGELCVACHPGGIVSAEGDQLRHIVRMKLGGTLEQARHQLLLTGDHVLPEITPGCEWVIAGEGVATRKYDGTCVMYDGDEWWARREVKPGKTVELKPGSYRLLMLGLKEPFQLGQKIKGTLVFEKAGPVEIVYNVEPFRAAIRTAVPVVQFNPTFQQFLTESLGSNYQIQLSARYSF